MNPDWLRPDWSVSGAGGMMSTRAGGQSTAPFDRLNVGNGVGDDPAVVARNRAIFRAATGGAAPVFLKQVHGTRVVRLTAQHAASNATVEEADASITTEPGLACTVLVADCLPVLFTAPDGRAVGAAHAGWRGLRGGVLEATLREVCAAGVCAPDEVSAWLGACIGPRRFEVGPDVLEAFGAAQDTTVAACFAPLRPGKWLADLPRLARMRLAAAGVTQVSGGAWCTVEDPSRFFSFRRDGVTGRMAAAVWIAPGAGRRIG
jgi:YfiH family protein